MSDAKTQQEPSMEEILASIRRIIAEDHDPNAAPAAEEPATQAAASVMPDSVPPEPLDDEDVLELTNLVAEETREKAPEPEEEDDPFPRFRVEMDRSPPPPPPPLDEDRLVSEATASASAAAFSTMASRVNRRRSSDFMMGNAGLTLEEIVRDELRPLLRSWLDANLPSLVERLVREELDRIARDAV